MSKPIPKIPIGCELELEQNCKHCGSLLRERKLCNKPVRFVQFMGLNTDPPVGSCSRAHCEKDWPIFEVAKVRWDKEMEEWEVLSRGKWYPEFAPNAKAFKEFLAECEAEEAKETAVPA